MSLFGLHRAWRGALVGHFAVPETTSSPARDAWLGRCAARGPGPPAQHFYDEHVEADAVHEQVVRRDVLGGLLLEDEPQLAPDVAFAIQATTHLEDRLAEALLSAWREERTALRAWERRRGA
ncbi:iron-containing redox enzyme family protein [Streptomyces oceani]|uniref:iron-containing redox enzyme family protein n=1 Tax=Streptomyces oceani TaxID=1075402 RepID=UPI003B84565E